MKKLLALLLLSPLVSGEYRATWINHNGSSIAIDTFVYKESFRTLYDCENMLDRAAKTNYNQFDFEVAYKEFSISGDILLFEKRKI